jgi:hypothetical protein
MNFYREYLYTKKEIDYTIWGADNHKSQRIYP